TDGQTHRFALYLLDWDKAGRSERIDVLDATGAVVDSRTVSNFSNGVYLAWNVKVHVRFRITRLAGPNAVVSGLFFGGANPGVQFVAADTTTQGNWQGVYGGDGYNVINDAINYPSYAHIAVQGQTQYTFAASTTDTHALERASAPGRLAAAWYVD